METTAEKEERFQLAATRKIRRLSGWNIFQKQELEGNSLDPGSYRNKVKAIGQAWAHMSEEEKLPFEAEAARLEELRHELANTPLAAPNSKSAKTQALEDQIGRNSRKLFSARRLLLNEAEFDRHPLWQLPTCLADSNLACLLQTVCFSSWHTSVFSPFVCRQWQFRARKSVLNVWCSEAIKQSMTY